MKTRSGRSFADAVKHSMEVDSDDVKSFTRTRNGMRTRKNTASRVLDFFGKVGSSRGIDLTKEFKAALKEDEDLALRALQWTRDIRGGAGEREQFRTILKNLDKDNPIIAARLVPKIPLLGRFDDLFSYVNPKSRRLALETIRDALKDGNA